MVNERDGRRLLGVVVEDAYRGLEEKVLRCTRFKLGPAATNQVLTELGDSMRI
jgi:hypothetical protein